MASPNQHTAVPMPERFWSRVDTAGDCWLWLGARTDAGYGTINVNGRTVLTHRLAWELAGHEWIPGKQIDHLCRTPACVRVAHLELVTPRENTLRGFGPTAIAARLTACRNGHPFDGRKGRRGYRYCKRCAAVKQWVRDEAKRQARTALRALDAASQKEEA